MINICRFEDAVRWIDVPADQRVIVFPTAAYQPPCVAIEVGQTVTWSGNFGNHPLEGGLIKGLPPQPDNPIPTVGSGSTPVEVTFPDAGSWGYFCSFHEPPMSGAVYVALFADGFESGDACDWSEFTEPQTCP